MSATQTTRVAHAAVGGVEDTSAPAAEKEGKALKPFVGLVPLVEQDAKLLAGRDEEVKALMTNLRAARLTVVYGASGVGKSSVLRAGVVASLRAIGDEELNNFGTPSFAVVLLNSWAGDPFAELAESLQEGIKSALAVETLAPMPVTNDLRKMLQAWTDRYGLELLIILDQFEEFFLYHNEEDAPGAFAYELPLAVNSPDLRARFMISVRDDSLHLLDRFQGRLPTLLENRLHVVPLTRARARQAIDKAVAAYNETQPEAEKVQPEDGLVDAVLDQVSVDNISLGSIAKAAPLSAPAARAAAARQTAPGDALPPGAPVTDGIDAPYMQLVMSRLWDEESSRWKKGDASPRVLRLKTLTDLGGAQAVVQQHLDKVLRNFSKRERDIAADCFHYLVTQSGTKYALTPGELKDFTHHPVEEIQELLTKLADPKYRVMKRIDKRTLKGTQTAYEAHHDRLAVAMLAWRARKEEYRALRRRRFFLLGVLVLITTSVFVTTYKYKDDEVLMVRTEKEDAQKNANMAQLNANTAQQNAINASEQVEQREKEISKLIEDSDEEKLLELKGLVPNLTCGNTNPKRRQDAQKINSTLGIDCSKYSQIIQGAADPQLSPRVYFHIQTEEQRYAAGDLKNWLASQRYARRKYIVPGIEYVGNRNLSQSQVRYFHSDADEVDLAWRIALALKGVCVDVTPQYISGYEDSDDIRPRHFELWLTADALNNLCIPVAGQ